MFSSPERHVLTGQPAPRGHRHIRGLYKLLWNTAHPRMTHTWTNSRDSVHIVSDFVFVLLTERLLLLKHRSSLGFRAQRADVIGRWAVPVCSSTAENYRAPRHRHLLTCIRCQDKQRAILSADFQQFASQNEQHGHHDDHLLKFMCH